MLWAGCWGLLGAAGGCCLGAAGGCWAAGLLRAGWRRPGGLAAGWWRAGGLALAWGLGLWASGGLWGSGPLSGLLVFCFWRGGPGLGCGADAGGGWGHLELGAAGGLRAALGGCWLGARWRRAGGGLGWRGALGLWGFGALRLWTSGALGLCWGLLGSGLWALGSGLWALGSGLWALGWAWSWAGI